MRINMDIEKWKIYEREKQRIKQLPLTLDEYQRRIKELAEKLKL